MKKRKQSRKDTKIAEVELVGDTSTPSTPKEIQLKQDPKTTPSNPNTVLNESNSTIYEEMSGTNLPVITGNHTENEKELTNIMVKRKLGSGNHTR